MGQKAESTKTGGKTGASTGATAMSTLSGGAEEAATTTANDAMTASTVSAINANAQNDMIVQMATARATFLEDCAKAVAQTAHAG